MTSILALAVVGSWTYAGFLAEPAPAPVAAKVPPASAPSLPEPPPIAPAPATKPVPKPEPEARRTGAPPGGAFDLDPLAPAPLSPGRLLRAGLGACRPELPPELRRDPQPFVRASNQLLGPDLPRVAVCQRPLQTEPRALLARKGLTMLSALKNFFAQPNGSIKGALSPEELFRSILASLGSGTTIGIVMILLQSVLTNASTIFPNPTVASLATAFLTLVIDLLRRQTQGNNPAPTPAPTPAPVPTSPSQAA